MDLTLKFGQPQNFFLAF